MLKLIITFPQMEEAMKAVHYDGTNDDAWKANWDKWYYAEHAAMEQLEETAFALAMERVRRTCGEERYFSDHVGLFPEYNGTKGVFAIDADLLYPELIAVLEDLQKLGSFKMHFENDAGELVHDDWWRSEDLRLYDPYGCPNYDYEALVEKLSA